MCSPPDSSPDSWLNDAERDALRELFNIAFGRAAASLAQIVDRRILLSPPRLLVCRARKVADHLPTSFHAPLTHVRQAFRGPFHGEIHILLPQDDLLPLLALTPAPVHDRDEILASDIEAFGEVGNILLNAVVATFHLVTGEHFRVSLPQTGELRTPSGALFPLPSWVTEKSLAILALAHLEVAQEGLEFVLIVFLEPEAVCTLLRALEHLLPNSGA